jgi:HEAT repeat protein
VARPDPGERWQAGDALGRMGRGAVPALIALLREPDYIARHVAAKALGEIGPDARDAVPALVAVLSDREYAVRSAAIDALGAIGPGASGAVGSLESLRQRDPMTRPSVDRALQAIGAPAPPR